MWANWCANLGAKRAVCDCIPCASEEALIKSLATANDNMMAAVQKLESDLADMPEGETEASQRMAHVVVPDMERIRGYADEMEKLCARDYWPFPHLCRSLVQRQLKVSPERNARRFR